MEKRVNTKSGRFLASLLILLIVISSSILCGQSKALQHSPPPADMEPMDAANNTWKQMPLIDTCIFTCDFCFKEGDTLVRCANECIIHEGVMGRMWRQACPFFGQQPIFTPNKLFK